MARYEVDEVIELRHPPGTGDAVVIERNIMWHPHQPWNGPKYRARLRDGKAIPGGGVTAVAAVQALAGILRDESDAVLVVARRMVDVL